MSNSQQQPQPSPLLSSRRPANATGSSSSTSSSWPNKLPVRPSSRALAAASNAVAHTSSAATAGRLGVGRKSAAASKLWGSSSLSSLSSSSISTNNPKVEPKKRVTAGGHTSSTTALQNSSRQRQQPASIRAAATTRAAASACRRVLGAGSVSSTTTAAAPTAAKQSETSSSYQAPAGYAAQSSTDNSGFSSQLSASAPFVSRAVYEQRRLANQLAKERVHQLLRERRQQQQQGAKHAREVVILTRRGIQDAVAAQAGEQVAKAAVEAVYKYQLGWGSTTDEAKVAAAQLRVGEALASQERELRQKAPGCCSSSVLHCFRALHKTAKLEHQLFHLALSQAQQS